MRGVVARLGTRGEAGTLDDDHGAADADIAVGRGEGRRDAGAVRVGERQVHGAGLHEGPHAAMGAVDELVRHHQVTRGDGVTEPAHGTRRQHLPYAK